MQIKYVKMPITFEEKRALNKQGYKVVDAKFDLSPKLTPKSAPKRRIGATKK